MDFIKLDPDSVVDIIKQRGRISTRQLAKHFCVGFVRMSKFMAKVQWNNRQVKSEFVRFGDGRGVPAQELLFMFKEPQP